jgi:Leucine-rich repeat (LRR) protein
MGGTTSHIEPRFEKACKTHILSLSGLNIKNMNVVISKCLSRKVIEKTIWLQTPIYVWDASHNKLKELPDKDFPYLHLRTCLLAFNRLKHVSSHFCAMAHVLERLDVSHNRLVTLPKEVSQLTALQYLNVAHNGLTHVPEELAFLPHLELLDLEENQLETLPVVWGSGCGQLIELNLKRNRLRALPSECHGWIRLRRLLLDENLIIELPQSLFQCTPQLTLISLNHNPLKDPTALEGSPGYSDYLHRRKDQIDKKLHANLHNISKASETK